MAIAFTGSGVGEEYKLQEVRGHIFLDFSGYPEAWHLLESVDLDSAFSN
jgi:hypothetical protein